MARVLLFGQFATSAGWTERKIDTPSLFALRSILAAQLPEMEQVLASGKGKMAVNQEIEAADVSLMGWTAPDPAASIRARMMLSATINGKEPSACRLPRLASISPRTFFRFTALMTPGSQCCAGRFGGISCWRCSAVLSRA